MPSGGDWSIHRGGALLLENATAVEVSDCLLDAPGGNGIFLSNLVQRCDIHHNEVRFAGDSAIAALGSTNGMAALGEWSESHPRDNAIHHNHLHNWGVWGKQTSAYFGSLVRRQRFEHNVVYNGPRAAVNLNDGFAGGNSIARNLLFNTVLDTGDHGQSRALRGVRAAVNRRVVIQWLAAD